MFFTIVPCLTTDEAPLIFKSLITETSSPSINTFPLASRYTFSFGVSSTSISLVHSLAHIVQSNKFPSSYVKSESHLGQFGKSVIHIPPGSFSSLYHIFILMLFFQMNFVDLTKDLFEFYFLYSLFLL